MQRTRLLGIGVDRVNTAELLGTVERFLEDRRQHQICYVNAECMNRSVLDRRYRQILEDADLVYADGMGVVWVSRVFGEPLAERVTLGDCLPQLCQLCREGGYRLFLLGGEPGIARRAAGRLRRRVPGVSIVGTHHGYVAAEEAEAVVAQINRAKPDILLVGMGVPKQEKWIWQHRKRLHVQVLWGVGAVLDYYAGKTPRAPVWLRRVGLEWFFRLLVEPRRLWRRYLLGNMSFTLRACALILTDTGLVTVAWLGAYALRQRLNELFGFSINPVESYVAALPLIVGIWLMTCATFGLYRRFGTMSAIGELAQVIRATWLGLLVTMAVAFLVKEFSFGRSVVLLFGGMTFGLLSVSRMAIRAVERRLARRGLGLRRTLIVGTGSLARRLKEEIELWPVGYEIVGFVADGERNVAVPRDQIAGSTRELGTLVRERSIQDVFIASQNRKLHQTLNLLAKQERWAVNFHVVAEELEPFAERVPVGRVVHLPLLDLPSVRLNGWYEGSKRLFDVVVASVGLLCCLPLLAVIALVVRAESQGPVLFTQQRVGRHGRHFRMYKFRTMRAETARFAEAPNDPRDPRVGPVGRLLRRWSLDELPQLVNVVKGDMSLVGPRPEMPFLVRRYQPWQRRRFSVRPGLTGLWQVVGRKELPLHRNVEYDLYYVRHRGWLLDASILLRTIPAVLCRRGAF